MCEGGHRLDGYRRGSRRAPIETLDRMRRSIRTRTAPRCPAGRLPRGRRRRRRSFVDGGRTRRGASRPATRTSSGGGTRWCRASGRHVGQIEVICQMILDQSDESVQFGDHGSPFDIHPSGASRSAPYYRGPIRSDPRRESRPQAAPSPFSSPSPPGSSRDAHRALP